MSQPLVQFQPVVASYTHQGYTLSHDLQCVQRSHEAEIREATVFYAARILEALSGDALDGMGLEGKPNSFANLTTLAEYGQLPKHTQYWAHALRRSGNAARHAHRQTPPAEEVSCLAFLEYWLRWFFCEFPFGARLPDLTVEPDAPVFVYDEVLRRALALSASQANDPGEAAAEILHSQCAPAADVPAPLAVLAERLLNANRLEEARALLEEARRRHPDDLRLAQLCGLCYSRAGLLDEAVGLLEPLYKRYRTDEETAGIMAGVYKRMWRQDPATTAWLSKSRRAYKIGWKQDRDNTYLGINVASTSLLLGDADQARTVAGEIRDVLLARQDLLARAGQDRPTQLTLWDQLTLVEAELLCGEGESAGRRFLDIAANNASAAGALTVACRQFIDVAEQTSACADVYHRYLEATSPSGETP